MTLHRVVPLLFAWLLAAPITLAAQTADTVRGVVYDSLLKAPLQGALVLGSVPGQEQVAQATTDANGQFLLVAPGRIERLTVFHEELEQLGLALDARRGAEDMRWTPRLGVPSLATLWLRLCHRPIPATGEQPAIVYGTLRLADGSTESLALPSRSAGTRRCIPTSVNGAERRAFRLPLQRSFAATHRASSCFAAYRTRGSTASWRAGQD